MHDDWRRSGSGIVRVGGYAAGQHGTATSAQPGQRSCAQVLAASARTDTRCPTSARADASGPPTTGRTAVVAGAATTKTADAESPCADRHESRHPLFVAGNRPTAPLSTAAAISAGSFPRTALIDEPSGVAFRPATDVRIERLAATRNNFILTPCAESGRRCLSSIVNQRSAASAVPRRFVMSHRRKRGNPMMKVP